LKPVARRGGCSYIETYGKQTLQTRRWPEGPLAHDPWRAIPGLRGAGGCRRRI